MMHHTSNSTTSSGSGSNSTVSRQKTELHPLTAEMSEPTNQRPPPPAAAAAENLPLSYSFSSSHTDSVTTPTRQQQHPPIQMNRSRYLSSAASTTSTVPSTTTSVASLIQSAAKVSLYNNTINNDREDINDSPTPSNSRKRYTATDVVNDGGDKLFPDNEYDDFVHSLFVSSSKQQQQPYEGNLQSLQQEILPTLPNEQDRKRFLGCIAAVIVALYQYETEREETKPNPPSRQTTTNSNTNTTSDDNKNCDVSMMEENTWSQSLYDDDHDANAHPNHAPGYENDDDDDAFDYFEDLHDNSISSASSSSLLSVSQQQRRTTTNTSTAATTSNSSSSSNGLFTSRSHHEATLRAQQRYRKRRYEIYGHFLIASTEHLQLEKGHGRCFLPILEQLLVPNNHNKQQAQRNISQRRYSRSNSLYSIDYLQYQMNEMANLRPFLEGLSPGAGIRCVAMLLVQHLLQGHGNGYDARVRHVLKSVGVLVLLHDIMIERLHDQEKMGQSLKQYSLNTNDILFVDETDDPLGASCSNNGSDHHRHNNINGARQEIFPADLLTLATRQFESLEQYMARKFLEISAAQQQQQQKQSTGRLSSRDISGSTRDKFFRGLKIGGTAVAAGTLFAITGGLGKIVISVYCSYPI
jgi:hypothetical protein